MTSFIYFMSDKNYCSGRLIEKTYVSDRLAVFKFLPSERLLFKAGQYATLSLEVDGELCHRPYSIVSSPREEVLEFFIELVPNGVLTPRLWELKLDSSIWIRRRIVGQLTLTTDCHRHLMLATVTGIAPFVSIARTKHFDDNHGDMTDDELLIIQGASRSRDFGPYQQELLLLSQKGWLKYVPTVSRIWEDPTWQGEIGRLEDILRKHADQFCLPGMGTSAYACGHPKMIENVKEILLRDSFTPDRIKEEDYFALRSEGMPQESHQTAVASSSV